MRREKLTEPKIYLRGQLDSSSPSLTLILPADLLQSPHWPNPPGSRGQERRDGAVRTHQLPMTESIVKKGRESIWRVKGRRPESYVTIHPYWNEKLERLLSWSTLGLKEELNLVGKRSWRPLRSTKMTPMRSSIESLVQRGKIKDGARK